MFDLPDRPLTWVFTGDSITQGVYHTHGYRTWFELAYERLRFQLDRLEDVMINTGMSGWTAQMVADKYDWLIGRFAPDVLSIAVGTNDANIDPAIFATPEQVTERLVAMIERARDAGTERFLLHTPALITRSAYGSRPDFDRYADAVRAAAEQTGATLVDHDRVWRETWADAEPLEWLDDPIHPNYVGHRRMADTLFEALGVGPYSE